MHKLSDNVTRKFEDIVDLTEWEIESDSGWEDVASINQTIEYEVYKIKFTDGTELLCADNHILITSNNEEVFAKDSLGVNIIGKHGLVKVASVVSLDYKERMYDVSVNSCNHTYFTNNILSHNTITSAACILHYSIFNSNKTIAILANKSTAAREVLSRYQIMYENLPLWMQQGIKTWNKGDVELENGSKVFTSATSTSGIRGKSVNWLYIDEAAIIPNNVAEEFFTSTYPTIMAGETTKVLLTSTPLGYNHFWKFWNDATEGRNGFVPLQIEYWKIPGRDEKWAAEQKAVLGELKFNQEVLCTFLGSSNTLIAPDTIARLSPISWLHSKDGLDVLEYPIAGHTYFCSVDTSRGVGGDYSAFTVMDTTEFPFKIVAKYRDNKISPLLYPTVIHKICRDYNYAYVLVEINDIGQQIADIIHNDLEYENMIWVGNDSRYGQVMSSSGRHSNLGVRTTKQIKRIGCSTLKSLVEENKLLVFDQDIISEFSTFIEHNGVFQADEGYHDDLTMTLVLFAWATNDPMFKDLMNVNNRQAMYSAQMQSIEDELTPFGFIDNGIPEEEQAIIDGQDLWLTDRYKKDYSDFISERRWN